MKKVTEAEIEQWIKDLRHRRYPVRAAATARLTEVGKPALDSLEKLIKSGYDTCQFLREDRRCGVYPARPRNCREYVCWDQPDETVYDFARFFQTPVGKLRRREAKEKE